MRIYQVIARGEMFAISSPVLVNMDSRCLFRPLDFNTIMLDSLCVLDKFTTRE